MYSKITIETKENEKYTYIRKHGNNTILVKSGNLEYILRLIDIKEIYTYFNSTKVRILVNKSVLLLLKSNEIYVTGYEPIKKVQIF